MNRRGFLSATMGAAIAAFAIPGAALATNHLAKAIAEINKAIPYGEEPAHSSSFVQHIDNAIDHAVMAQRAHANRHIKRAIAYLRRARKTAYGTHLLKYSRRAASLAKKALTQLRAAG
ncbi:small metal-binding protein SmbP [Methylocystis sp.]|uniref:small metal-binding protein SmbP n=1 Tax=Methylocystis sp. TaxID=1911079 RepID=UPI003D102001